MAPWCELPLCVRWLRWFVQHIPRYLYKAQAINMATHNKNKNKKRTSWRTRRQESKMGIKSTKKRKNKKQKMKKRRRRFTLSLTNLEHHHYDCLILFVWLVSPFSRRSPSHVGLCVSFRPAEVCLSRCSYDRFDCLPNTLRSTRHWWMWWRFSTITCL